MSDMMKYNHAAIGEASASLAGNSQQINSILEDLKGQLKKLDAGWEGEGSDAYRVLKAQWDQAAESLNNTLHKVSDVVSQGNDAMKASDKSAAGAFGG
jgi:early secretory antigenic target protein ESAT-6